MKIIVNNKTSKGFSLVEVIVAIFVITIGIVGAVNSINFSISSVAIIKSQIIASDLAQEGIETVRNIRDTNWLEQRTNPAISWSDGLIGGPVDCSAGCRVQYNHPDLIAFSSTPLQIRDIGTYSVYGYNGVAGFSGGVDTRFYRKITINISVNEIRVVSEVTWSERGHSHTVNAEDRLYNWK